MGARIAEKLGRAMFLNANISDARAVEGSVDGGPDVRCRPLDGPLVADSLPIMGEHIVLFCILRDSVIVFIVQYKIHQKQKTL